MYSSNGIYGHSIYLCSGSLLAKSCKSAMMLAGHDELTQEKAFQFGESIAFARQVMQMNCGEKSWQISCKHNII